MQLHRTGLHYFFAISDSYQAFVYVFCVGVVFCVKNCYTKAIRQAFLFG